VPPENYVQASVSPDVFYGAFFWQCTTRNVYVV
jgi:hypothetical protein